jgi:threonine/homoserine/homoserine lactone efflux protein
MTCFILVLVNVKAVIFAVTILAPIVRVRIEIFHIII